MQESCACGSVRGASGNRRPYRDNCSAPASKTTSPTATCSKLWAQAGQARRMTVEGGNFFLSMRHTRRNRTEYLGQVATQKATPPILPRIGQTGSGLTDCQSQG